MEAASKWSKVNMEAEGDVRRWEEVDIGPEAGGKKIRHERTGVELVRPCSSLNGFDDHFLEKTVAHQLAET